MAGPIRRIATRALALVMMLAVATVALPRATAATVTCCCGAHDAHRDCGCVDCPAGHAAGAPATPSMKACRSQRAEVTLAAIALQAPPPIEAMHELVSAAHGPALPGCVDRDRPAPPRPPPRG